jgi:hypothetical protein
MRHEFGLKSWHGCAIWGFQLYVKGVGSFAFFRHDGQSRNHRKLRMDGRNLLHEDGLKIATYHRYFARPPDVSSVRKECIREFHRLAALTLSTQSHAATFYH